jgi:hypothetical protein
MMRFHHQPCHFVGMSLLIARTSRTHEPAFRTKFCSLSNPSGRSAATHSQAPAQHSRRRLKVIENAGVRRTRDTSPLYRGSQDRGRLGILSHSGRICLSACQSVGRADGTIGPARTGQAFNRNRGTAHTAS